MPLDLDALITDPTFSVPTELLTHPSCAEVIAPGVEIERRQFADRMEAAKYLDEILSDVKDRDIPRDAGLWAWLTLFFFDQVCPVDAEGNRKVGAQRATWIPQTDVTRRFYRHALLGPYLAYRGPGSLAPLPLEIGEVLIDPKSSGYGTFHSPDPSPRALNAVLQTASEHPFALDQPQAYLRWRERKLARYPRRAEDLIVEVRDPRKLTRGEAAEIRRVCSMANMAVYSSPLASVADKDIARRLGSQLGLARLHANPLADEDGISSLEVTPEKSGRGYIPYSNQRLLWHTDGYYNAPQQRIGAFILHCVRPAAAGGENRLLDHEIAYILLRDADPAHVAALCAPRAMTIPANTGEGALLRPAQTGPVFATDGGTLHMRYTARTRSIEWRADQATRAAVQFLKEVLDSDSRHVFTLRLAGGQGIVCNNVLHDRSAFTDDPAPGLNRLVYRARYHDRMGNG